MTTYTPKLVIIMYIRSIDLNYLKVPVDASEKMNDTLMDKLEPYGYEELKDFNTPYLAGYIAEKYNYDDSQLFPRVQSRINNYVESYISSTISGYSTTSLYEEARLIRSKGKPIIHCSLYGWSVTTIISPSIYSQ